jgi:lipopolysaccharide transport system ATP-binding protein
VASLLEVGTGFHPELTGRENIYLNGAILGMSRREVVRKFDEIVAFAEVEKFLDTPVKRYSSGMYVRLAFAVAAHLETDILMVDEVLAVGDASFQKKCLGKMGEVANEGRTVLFISHNMRAIQSMCGRSILLVNGRLVRTGTTDEVVNEYLGGLIDETSTPLTQRTDRTGDGRFRFVDLVFDSRSKDVIKCGEKIEIQMGFEAEGSPSNVNVSIAFSDITGTRALHLDNYVAGSPFKRLPETGRIVCTLDKFPLLPGRYTLNLYCTVDGKLADWIKDAAMILVADGDYFRSGCFPLSGYGYTVVDQRWGLGKDA